MRQAFRKNKARLRIWARRPLGPWRALPDFIIIGAMRGGTTSLYMYLIQHPRVARAFRKEIHFFDLGYWRGLNWYRAHFPSLPYGYIMRLLWRRNLITGESTPYYMFHPLAPRRIAETLPHVKLIVLLRNPVDRAYSHYWHAVNMGREALSFEEAVKSEPKRLRGEREKLVDDEAYHSPAYQVHSYLARGVYVDQLERWRALFREEQMLILCSEEFFEDPEASLIQVFGFLGLEACPLKKLRRYNEIRYPDMDRSVRARLEEYFRPHNLRLYEYLGRDFGWDG